MQFHLLYHYQKNRTKNQTKSNEHNNDQWPSVTIQLPIFNEKYVVERLIDNIMMLDYPQSLLQIQILDDSTDETVEISRRKAEEYRKKGFNVSVLSRKDRSGYKAGALKEAMPFVKGSLIAIFDADFLPNPDFLKKTVPLFNNYSVGVVQTRWEHINEKYSLLTRLQAFQLNVHFTVEQMGRFKGDYMLQFNGTAGVWRKSCIEDAGGWHSDTLTEDLDLSYRAQLKGWEIIFREDIGSPAELPAEMNGLKSQQFRWMKGGAETAKKMLPTIWKANLSLPKKIHGSMHLLASSVFLSVFTMGILSVPLLFFIEPLGINQSILNVFLISLIAVVLVYYVGNVEQKWHKEPKVKLVVKFLFIFPIFLALSMGLSLHNSIAVIQGYLGKKSAFIRTPKFNIKKLSDGFENRQYLPKRITTITIVEGLLALYFLVAFIASYQIDNSTFRLLHLMLFFGYGATFYYSVKHANA